MLTLGLIFWILMILWAFFSFPGNTVVGAHGPLAGWLLIFVLFGLLGWHVFGPIVR